MIIISPMQEATIIKKLREDAEKLGLVSLSAKTGIGYGTLWYILNTGEIKTKRIFKILEKHYN